MMRVSSRRRQLFLYSCSRRQRLASCTIVQAVTILCIHTLSNNVRAKFRTLSVWVYNAYRTLIWFENLILKYRIESLSVIINKNYLIIYVSTLSGAKFQTRKLSSPEKFTKSAQVHRSFTQFLWHPTYGYWAPRNRCLSFAPFLHRRRRV